MTLVFVSQADNLTMGHSSDHRLVTSQLVCSVVERVDGQTDTHALYESAYSHWKKIWKDLIFLDREFCSDDFSKIDNLIVVHKRNSTDIVGLVGCNFYNLSSQMSWDCCYLKSFRESGFLDSIQENTIVMSLEYVSASPLWRKKNLGFSVGSVMIGLASELFKSSCAKYSVGVPRTKNCVDQLSMELGFKEIGSVNKLGHSCSLVVNSKNSVEEHGDKNVAKLIKRLWLGRNRVEEYSEDNQLKLLAGE